MSITVDVLVATPAKDIPPPAALQRWSRAALAGRRDSGQIAIRLVDEEESRSLNARYRGVDRATNVLSFPADVPELVGEDLLGDLAVCAAVVAREAREQGKTREAHWAHMVIHGSLHLIGFDHETAREADEMESLEVEILAALGYPDPYRPLPATQQATS